MGKIAENRLNRRFSTPIPHQKITTDTTEFKYYENGIQKKAYLNPSQALEVTSDCPYRRTFHFDQGWAYQMPQYIHTLKEHQVFQSMSRKGNCHDNSVMENFFALLKQENYYGRVFNSYQELREEIIDWITYYNTKRIKKKLNWMSPAQFRLIYQN